MSEVEPSARAVGVVVVPEGFDAETPIGGLVPLLRAALAFQSAGVSEVVFSGTSADVRDPRLFVPVARELASHGRALVIRSDVTSHRVVPQRLLAVADLAAHRVVRIGDSTAAVYACRGDATEEVVRELARGAEPSVDERIELLAGLSAEFVVRAGTPAERAEATQKHLRSLIKNESGYFERLYMRPLSRYLTWALSRTRVTPNMMSIVTFALGLGSAALVALPSVAWNQVGAVLHLVMRIVDCVDGELSRLRYQGSRFGAWLDSICDGISMAAFVLAIGYRLDQLGSPYAIVGYVGAGVWMLVQLLEWRGALLADTGGSVQAVTWGHRKEEKSLLEQLVSKVELFMRIDAISTYYGVLVLVGALEPLVVAHTVLSSAAVLYYLSQIRTLAPRT